jgi:transcriptional regulator with XRE-family HTH domain
MGSELKRLRQLTGRTQGDVAAAIGRTHPTIVNWEHGNTKISKSDLAFLLAELRAPAAKRVELEEMRLEAAGRGRSPWATYALPEWFQPLVSFEQDAATVETFQPVLVPGLLQTERYARAVHTSGRHKVPAECVDKWVAARMRRQTRLYLTDPLKLRAVISESVLRLEAGGPEVFGEQVQKLIDSAAMDNVSLQVLPLAQAGCDGVASNYMLIHFADPQEYPSLAYYDGPLGGTMLDQPGDVATMVAMFDDVRRLALSEADSAEFLAAVLKEHRRKGSTHV